MKRRLTVLQLAIPDYRLAFFDELSSFEGYELTTYSGAHYFQDNILDESQDRPWAARVVNYFICGRRLAWQSVPAKVWFSDSPVVQELNPRILSYVCIALIRRLLRLPVVYWGHVWARKGGSSASTVWLRIALWYLADARIVYTRRQAAELKAFCGLSACAANNALFSRAQELPLVEISPKRFVYVGRLVAAKRVDLLVDGFVRSGLARSGYSLDIVGDGPELERLSQKILSSDCVSAIILHGRIAPESVSSFYTRALAAVSPGYGGLAITQALFFGVPILIADNEPHAPEIEACDSGFNTVWFEARNADDLAEKMKLLVQDGVLWGTRREAISQAVSQRYSIKAMVNAFVYACRVSLMKNQFEQVV